MTTIIRNQRPEEFVPDARENVDAYYSLRALDGATFVEGDDINGNETYRLRDGRLATLYSVDLDWVEPREDKVLRTSPIGAFADVQWVGLTPDSTYYPNEIESALFIIGDTQDDIERASILIEDRLGGVHHLDDYVVIEVTTAEWDIAKRGQNINKGWFIPEPNFINTINP